MALGHLVCYGVNRFAAATARPAIGMPSEDVAAIVQAAAAVGKATMGPLGCKPGLRDADLGVLRGVGLWATALKVCFQAFEHVPDSFTATAVPILADFSVNAYQDEIWI